MSVEFIGKRTIEGSLNPAFKDDQVQIKIHESSETRLNGSKNHNGYNSIAYDKIKGSVLSAHNVNYTVDVARGFCKGKEKKQILHDVTGVFRPGMNAIMGQTGSGKSTFLDILADRKDKRCVSGTLLLDNKPVPNNFKCMVGYVVQDDVVMGTLTIRENFAFSAALRLPTSISPKERKELIEGVIKELGLKKCADTKVGNAFLRGVSGGERRRCNIGMELIISPSVLFLDEPTTGLDANTANSVLHYLWRLSRRGHCIVFSIHQPRYSIYRMFDNIMLLSDGHTIYHGPASETLDFFSQQGFECQKHNNPTDFFLDVLNGDLMGTALDENKESILSMEQTVSESQHDKLLQAFKSSSWYRKLEAEAGEIMNKFNDQGGYDGKPPDKVDYATSFGHQMAVMAGRQVRNLVRNPQTSVMTIGASIFFGTIASIIFWQLDDTSMTGILDRSGALFFLLMNQMFFNFSALEIFISERKTFMHENISGFYRVSVYFLVKIFFDLMPLRLLPVSIVSSITYFSIGLQSGADHFFLFVLTLYAVTLTASSLCFFISSLVRVFAVAQMMLALCFVIMVLFGGFIVNLSSIGEWISWLKYISVIKYGFSALCINEFKDVTFCNGTICEHGNAFLITRDIDFEDDWDFWKNYVALFSLSFILFTMSYISLRLMKKHT